ncbi:plasmid mobilization protein [Escherichia coli O78:H12 str. 00-3279]|nr:plasmid mobilization protein [Escherichia coli O78:H12 str. 00-3279]
MRCSRQNRVQRVLAVRVMRRYGKSIWGVIGFWAALCPHDLVYESKVDMIFSAIALITGTATEFPNCL